MGYINKKLQNLIKSMDKTFSVGLGVRKWLRQSIYFKHNLILKSKDGYCWVEDTTVYEWAINYWSKSDEELGIKRVIPTPKTKAEVTRDEVIPEVKQVGQLSLF